MVRRCGHTWALVAFLLLALGDASLYTVDAAGARVLLTPDPVGRCEGAGLGKKSRLLATLPL